MLHTTFNKLREAGACTSGYGKLAVSLGGVKNYGRDMPIPLDKIIESNGLQDTLWTLQCTIERSEDLSIEFSCRCAEHVLYLYEDKYPNDKRPRQAIAAARICITDKSSAAAMVAARAAVAAVAARDAARDTTEAAMAAVAAMTAAMAAWDAAMAAFDAAREAAVAARDAARSVAWDAAEAAWDAARAVAREAARAVARDAAEAAWDAARAAEEKWQIKMLLELLEVNNNGIEK